MKLIGEVVLVTGAGRGIGTVAAFPASNDAGHLTGQSIFVDAGWQGQ